MLRLRCKLPQPTQKSRVLIPACLSRGNPIYEELASIINYNIKYRIGFENRRNYVDVRRKM